jgi:hypothetical protein
LSVINYALFDATFSRRFQSNDATLYGRFHQSLSLERMIETLKKMADFCSENVQQGYLNGKAAILF